MVYLSVNKNMFSLSFDNINQINSDKQIHLNDSFEASVLVSDSEFK